jgi:hypothetical protein
VERGRPQAGGGGEEGVRVVRSLAALGDDDEGLALVDGAQAQLLLAEVDEGGVAEDGALLPIGREVTITYNSPPGLART